MSPRVCTLHMLDAGRWTLDAAHCTVGSLEGRLTSNSEPQVARKQRVCPASQAVSVCSAAAVTERSPSRARTSICEREGEE